jgi:ribokinase
VGVATRKPIVVVGSINLDLVASSKRAPRPGETLSGTEFAIFNGGKGANQAVAAGKLGYPVRMIGKVGSDAFGAGLKLGLRKAGVDVKAVEAAKGSSGVALINLGADGQNSIVVVAGANGKVLPKDVAKHARILKGAGMILSQLEIPLITVETLAVFAHRNKVPMMLDPAPARELPPGLLQLLTWITPNETEAKTLCGLSADEEVNEKVARDCAEILLKRGCRNVIIKMGARGAFLATEDGGRDFVEAFPVKAVDSTAAGDAYNAAFAASLLSGKKPREAARYAAAVAAISVTRAGAQPSMPTANEVSKFSKARKG